MTVSMAHAAPTGSSLFLVSGRDASPAGAVIVIGGRLVVRLPGGTKVLALMTFDAQAQLQASPDIELVRAVAVDEERFSNLARLVALDRASLETGGGLQSG